MESRDQRIVTLATTLKSSGIAKTDSQARMMAEDMIGVEEHVQKSYEEEHVKAQEYLQTAKNLRIPRPASASEIAEMELANGKKSASKVIEPIATKSNSSNNSSSNMRSTNSDSNFNPVNSGKNNESSGGHDTHNSALEAIKSQIQKEANVSKEEISITSDNTEDLSLKDAVRDTQMNKNSVTEKQVDTTTEVTTEDKLDAKKLVELMEEDGKLEEHTREIKEAPKNVKPKEEYAENSIDLSSVFGFKK